MLPLVLWTVVALVTAALVLVVASAAGGRGDGMRTFLADMVAGVRGIRTRGQGGDRPRPGPEPVDTTIDDFFAAAEVQDPAYLAAEDLTETLARARERASRGVSGLTRR